MLHLVFSYNVGSSKVAEAVVDPVVVENPFTGHPSIELPVVIRRPRHHAVLVPIDETGVVTETPSVSVRELQPADVQELELLNRAVANAELAREAFLRAALQRGTLVRIPILKEGVNGEEG